MPSNRLTRRALVAAGAGAAASAGLARSRGALAQSATPAAKPGEIVMPATWDELGIMKGFPPPEDKRVSKANWQQGPWNRWAFQHMRQVFPTAVVSRGDGPVMELPYAPVDLGGLPVGDTGMTVSQMFERAYADAVVVLHDGQLVWEQYWDGMTEATPHLLMSVTKSFTGTLGGILLDRGLLEPDRTIGEYLPELKDSGFGDATVRQALDMQVDIEWSENPDEVAKPDSAFNRYLNALGFTPTTDVGGAYTYLPTIQKVGEPGVAFHYVSPVTDMFGWLLEKVSGKPYAELLSDEIFSKLGAEHDACVILGAEGKALTTGGLNMTCRDLARFGQMMLQDGRINGHRVAPASFVDDVRFNGDVAKYHIGHTDRPTSNYRSYWWVNQVDDASFEGRGIHGQQLWVSHPHNLVLARFSSYPVTSGPELFESAAALLTIAEALGGA